MPDLTVSSRSPEALRVKEILRIRIMNGSYPPGSWLPTERTLTVELNVSRTTVRAALAELEKQGMIVRQPGKRPWVSETSVANNVFATRSLTPPVVTPVEGSNGTGTVETRSEVRRLAVVLPNRTADLATRAILDGIHRAFRLRQIPYRLMTFDTELSMHGALSRVDLEVDACAAIAHDGVDGVIFWPLAGKDTMVDWQRLQEMGIAIVCVDRLPPGLECDFVGVDNYHAAREAVDYLLKRGHRKIAHITSNEDATTVHERTRGYTDALTSFGKPPAPEMILTLHYHDQGRVTDEKMSAFLVATMPTAVFTMNDHIAHRLVYVAENLGMVVGRDISIIGFDDIDRYSPRPALLTTMRQPFDRIGECAAELILQRVTDPNRKTKENVYRQYYLSAPLIERSTCGMVAAKTTLHHRVVRGTEY